MCHGAEVSVFGAPPRSTNDEGPATIPLRRQICRAVCRKIELPPATVEKSSRFTSGRQPLWPREHGGRVAISWLLALPDESAASGRSGWCARQQACTTICGRAVPSCRIRAPRRTCRKGGRMETLGPTLALAVSQRRRLVAAGAEYPADPVLPAADLRWVGAARWPDGLPDQIGDQDVPR